MKYKNHPKDLTGMRFGRLTVVKKLGVRVGPHDVWLCKCDCGNHTIAIRSNLIQDFKLSCGCERITTFSAETLKMFYEMEEL